MKHIMKHLTNNYIKEGHPKFVANIDKQTQLLDHYSNIYITLIQEMRMDIVFMLMYFIK